MVALVAVWCNGMVKTNKCGTRDASRPKFSESRAEGALTRASSNQRWAGANAGYGLGPASLAQSKKRVDLFIQWTAVQADDALFCTLND